MLSFDIVIIGGGIAGLSTAREISQKCSANIVIIEEHKKVGLPAKSSAFSFVDTVKKYGLDKAVKKYYSQVGHYSFLGSKAIFKLNGPKLAVLDHSKACQEILLHSRQNNIEIFDNTKAVGLRRMNGKIAVNTVGENEGFIKCNLLIDASGASFFSARFTRFRIPGFYSQPYGYELENCDIPESFLDQMSFFVGRSIGSGGGWFYPLTKSVCTFGIAEITRTPVFPRDKLKSYYHFAKHNMQPFSEMIKNAKPCTRKAGTIPAEPMKDLVSDNIMRVGDASGHATPHILEGTRPCIESATLCGKVASEAYEKQDFSESFLEKYERTWHGQNKLSYLYQLSFAEVLFSYDDQRMEKRIRLQAKRRVNPEAYLRGLKGHLDFPFALMTSKPDLNRLRVLARFLYHNVRWILE